MPDLSSEESLLDPADYFRKGCFLPKPPAHRVYLCWGRSAGQGLCHWSHSVPADAHPEFGVGGIVTILPVGFRSKGLFTRGTDFVGNSPSAHTPGSALIHITGFPLGGIKALCVLLSQGTAGRSFPPLIISNQRFGEMLRGFISFIGEFLASRVAVDGRGTAQPEGSRGNLCLAWL